jgi:hypothetical protein
MPIYEFNKWILFFDENPPLETLVDTHLANLEYMTYLSNFDNKTNKKSLEDFMMLLSQDDKKEIKNQRLIKELDRL